MKNEQRSFGSRAFDALNVLLMAIVILVTIYPFWNILVASFSTIQHVMGSPFLLFPDGIHLDAYMKVFLNALVSKALGNSLFIVTVGTSFSMLLTILCAFVLSRRGMPGKRFMTMFTVFTMLFSGGLIPYYLTVKAVGMLNKIWSLIIPGAMNTYNMLIMRSFFVNVPESLYESASIDGSNMTKYLVKILLPLSMPSIATVTLFYLVGYWNAYFEATIFINDRYGWPIQAVLRDIIVSSQMETIDNDPRHMVNSILIKDALIVVTAVPIICVYPFVQRFFVKGVMVGSIKE